MRGCLLKIIMESVFYTGVDWYETPTGLLKARDDRLEYFTVLTHLPEL